MVPADAFRSAATLNRSSDFIILAVWPSGNPTPCATNCFAHRDRVCHGRSGGVDAAFALQPCHQYPTCHGPGRANAPARQYIGRIMDAQINSAQADEHGKQRRKRHEIDPHRARGVCVGEKRSQCQICNGRHSGVSAWETWGEDPGCRSHEIRPGPRETELEDIVQRDTAQHRTQHQPRFGALASYEHIADDGK